MYLMRGRWNLKTGYKLALLLGMALAAPLKTTAQESRLPPQLPAGALDVINAAEGIQFNGPQDSRPDLQLVCDANCPYCAKLYVQLRDDLPEHVVRWVPIAYFKPDSASLAAQILSSGDPAAALDRNYRTYDFVERRGGYQSSDGRTHMLDYEHEVLRQHWRDWGGYTPMILAPDGQGQVYRARDTRSSSVRRLLEVTDGQTGR